MPKPLINLHVPQNAACVQRGCECNDNAQSANKEGNVILEIFALLIANKQNLQTLDSARFPT